MKKPIDPNLNNIGEEEIFQDLDLKGAENTPFNISEKSADENADDTVSVEEIMDEIEIPSLRKLTDSNKSKKSSGSSGHHHHHHHHHRHHSSSKKSENKLPFGARLAIGILLTLLGIVVAIAAVFFGMRTIGRHDMMKKVDFKGEPFEYQETIEYNGHTYRYNDDMLSMVFLGVDKEKLDNSANTDFVGASDADIVVAVNTKTGETHVIAIPRDTMVDVDIWSTSGIFLRTQKTQLCLAYAYGDGKEKSCENATTAISRVLYNIPIQKYYALDLNGIKTLNDAIGGVKVTALYPMEEYGVKVGDEVVLKGDMAEVYVRRRDMDDINASLNRTERQVQYVRAFADQALPAVVKDFSTISRLYNTVAGKDAETNITLNNATYVASLLLSKGVTEFETHKIEGEMKEAQDPIMPDVVHAEFYPDEDCLMETVLEVFYEQID